MNPCAEFFGRMYAVHGSSDALLAYPAGAATRWASDVPGRAVNRAEADLTRECKRPVTLRWEWSGLITLELRDRLAKIDGSPGDFYPRE